MADEQPGQERTEQPTEKRLQDARQKGQVPRSRELNTLLSLLLSAFALLFFGADWLDSVQKVFSDGLQLERAQLQSTSSLAIQLGNTTVQAVKALIPFFVLSLVAVFLGPLLMGGWSFSTQAIAFKLDKLDPIKGLTRVFSLKGLMELLKALVKFLLLLAVALILFRLFYRDILILNQLHAIAAMHQAAEVLLWSFLALSGAMVLVAIVDVPFERWNHFRQLRMTRQEVRDEMKETDGRPEVKQRIRTMQREVAQRRMMQDVPKADVVITNPTHYAVALRYQLDDGGAPLLVAKGKGPIAQSIREVADSANVPLFSAPPLARALYGSTEIGEEVPQELYLAVAKVLAYIFQLRTAEPTDYVPAPTDIEVPSEFSHSVSEDSSDGN